MTAEYLLPTEVAATLRVRDQVLKRMRMRGDGPPYLVLAGAIRYPRAEFEDWRKSRTVRNTAQQKCRA